MSYKVLYRKYRPYSFHNIIGQKNIVDTLKSSIIGKTFAHAYIFTGPRGTGKTSTAKVLAKTINCVNPCNGEACGQCESCLNFNTSPDIIEIDAASNNGVDEIRELRNNITLAPSSSNYKIYIIDEVHMLSPGAFNALLKTLEEPPAHAIFILATTEVYKVPITILSRCQRYDFKKIEKADMINHLKEICKQENITFEPEALEEIYDLSEGCLRDALGILDQTSKNKEKITLNTILKEYNIISNNKVQELLDYTFHNDVRSIISTIDEFASSGMNAQKLIKKMINYLEKLAIDIKLKKESRYSFIKIKNLITELNSCYIDARINENIFTMIKICFLELIEDSNKAVTSPKKEINAPNELEVIKTKEMSLVDIRINNCFVGANKEFLANIQSKWNNIDITKINSINIYDYKPVASSSEYTIFTAEEDSLVHLFNIKCSDIESMLKKENIPIKVVAITNEKWKQEKEKYIKNLKNNITYQKIEEPKPKDDSINIKCQLNDLFSEQIIEIN